MGFESRHCTFQMNEHEAYLLSVIYVMNNTLYYPRTIPKTDASFVSVSLSINVP